MPFFNHRWRYWFVLFLGLYTYASTLICGVYEAFSLPVTWYTALGSITLITLGAWESSSLLRPYLVRNEADQHSAVRRLLFFAGSSLIITLGITAFTVFAFDAWFPHPPIDIVVPLKLMATYAVLIILLFHLLHAVAYFMERYKNKQLEAEELVRINAQAQLQSIRSQVNPHFLFNNLNVLSSLVMQQNSNANRFIEAFSKVYQYILQNQEKELVPLQQELAFLETYTYLIKQRFPDSFQLHVELLPAHRNMYVIPIALQMLIENAIKHNIVSRQKPLEVCIKVNNLGQLVVSNTLQPKAHKEPSGQIGLNNIDKRYILTTGKSIAVVESENQFSVSLPLIQIKSYAGSNY